MKNLNYKQRAYSAKKVFLAQFKRLAFMWLLVFSVFAVSAAVDLVQGNQESGIISMAGFGAGVIILLTMADIGDIADVTDKYTQPNQIAYEFALIETIQIDKTVPFPTPNASREVSDITLLAGEVPHYFTSHTYPTFLSSGEMGDLTFSPTKEFAIFLGDLTRDEVLNFLEDKAGGKFLLFFKKCGDANYNIIGSLCKPMIFNNYEGKLDGDASGSSLKFGNTSLQQFYKYTGALQQAAAVEIPADAVDFAYTTGNAKYNTATANAGATVLVTVSGIASADYQKTLTIYGKGGANPHTIANNTVFILTDEVTWTGTVGSTITFRIQDDDTLVELSRVQNA